MSVLQYSKSVLCRERAVTSLQLFSALLLPRVWTVYILPIHSSSGEQWESWAQQGFMGIFPVPWLGMALLCSYAAPSILWKSQPVQLYIQTAGRDTVLTRPWGG